MRRFARRSSAHAQLFDAAGDLVGSCAARGWLFQTARSAAELEELLDQVQEQLERHGPVKDPQVEARIIRNFSADYRLPAQHPLWTFGVERADGLARRLPEPGQRLRMAGFAGLAYSYLGRDHEASVADRRRGSGPCGARGFGPRPLRFSQRPVATRRFSAAQFQVAARRRRQRSRGGEHQSPGSDGADADGAATVPRVGRCGRGAEVG